MTRNQSLLRKSAIALLSRALLRPLCLMPIRKTRVLFQSFLGKQYSCNPRYVSEELVRLAGGRLEIAWSFRDPEPFRALEKTGVRVLKSGTWEELKYALTARVVCVNTYYKPTYPRRRGQFYLRTWHGGGAYKRVGGAACMAFPERLFTRLEQSGASLYLSSSRAFTRLTLRESFGYRGEVMEKGMPRNDLLVNRPNPALADEIRREIGLTDGERLVLYAPTYRVDTRAHDFGLDSALLEKALSDRFGGMWRTAFRSHHVTMYRERGENARGALDVTLYPDMQRLLLVADALVTDYSSCMWDMSLAGKPVFLYCPDLNRFRAERDFYTDIRSWPFPLAETNAALAENVRSFREAEYAEALRNHHEALGSFETGRASFEAARRIMAECGLPPAD